MLAPMVVKKNNKWYSATLDIRFFKDEGKHLKLQPADLTYIRDVSKKSQVEDIEHYISIDKFAKKIGVTNADDLKETIRKNNISRAYIYEFSQPDGSMEFLRIWWSNINTKCLNCLHVCKQSAFVDVESCSKFEPKRRGRKKEISE